MERLEGEMYERLSPFELKDRLIRIAEQESRDRFETKDARMMLDAGRGNPNWVATAPREAYALLELFAVEEARRGAPDPRLGFSPAADGMGDRLRAFVRAHPGPGANLLRDSYQLATKELGFAPDPWMQEIVNGLLGDHYPYPDRMLPFCEQVVGVFLARVLCQQQVNRSPYEIYAVEGATAAMVYVFQSLAINGVLPPGSRIALGVPTFTPYLEIPQLEEYSFDVVPIEADQGDHWQIPDAEIDKLADPTIKAFFLVNPSNPPSVAVRPATLDRLADLVRTKRPDLIVLTDDVYAQFVDGFRSFLAAVPHNTIGVYSFSKYYGCTGWRLGTVAMDPEHVVDRLIASLPESKLKHLDERYAHISLTPRKVKFIDRLVADSRGVALNHTAGLSTPQQIMMELFALSSLVPDGPEYRQLAVDTVRRRLKLLYDGGGVEMPEDPLRAGYYLLLDFRAWARRTHGDEFARWVEARYSPLDLVFRLAERERVVLMNGGGFDGPPWSIRVSLANLPDAAYTKIGQAIRRVAESYHAEWKAEAFH